MSEMRPVPPTPPERREMDVAAWDDPRRPIIVVDGAARRRDSLDTVLRLLTGLVLAMVVLLLGAMLLLVASLAGTVSGAGTGIGQAGERLLGEAQRAAERVGDLVDPASPPRGGLDHDTEFDRLRILSVDEALGPLEEYTLTLLDIRKRDGARNRDEAQYAVLQRRLVEPRRTTLGPLVVREDWDEAELYLYKGETLRLGRDYHRVNWVSVEPQAMAIARYRSADDLTIAPKFQLD
jgi:hypothetical protein